MDLLDWTAALFLAVGPLLSVWIGLRRAEEILETKGETT